MNEWLETAAKLLGVSAESLLNFSQDTLNSMEAIILMFDVNEEEMASEAFTELESLWKKSILEYAMRDAANVIGFDYDYETLSSLEEQTQMNLMYAYLNDKSDVHAMYEIARKGVIELELKIVADFIDVPVQELRKLPKEKQENLYGYYIFNYDEIGTENNEELINSLKEMVRS